jgi:hypothetical protein
VEVVMGAYAMEFVVDGRVEREMCWEEGGVVMDLLQEEWDVCGSDDVHER